MSEVLYYSNYCQHCKNLLVKISRSQKKNDMHFICLDKREKGNDGSTHIIMENGQRLLLPPNVTKVPSILLLNRGNRVIDGLNNIYEYLKPDDIERNNNSTMFNGQPNGEPLAYSLSDMGTIVSDNYSFLDMTSEELSAKGDGGLRMIHNYTKINGNQVIETPPEDYVPNKVGNVDIGKIEAQRNSDVLMKDKPPQLQQN